MNHAIKVKDDIYWVGVNDRKTDLFESLWPLPRGVAYNAYLINDEKVALIDTVKAPFEMDYLQNIQKVIGPDRKVDYLIINHMEPDHSGAIQFLTRIFPDITIVGNKKTMEFLKDFYGVIHNTLIIEDGQSLSLGSRTLQFHITPMVHWPETMMTYEGKSGMLFSGDAFGGFGTLDGGVFDDELDMDYFEDEMLRYFSNIVGKYSMMVLKAIDKVKHLDIQVIGATHGPILRKNPGIIIERYAKWSRQETEKGVVIVFGSMYGNTEKMAERIARSLAVQGVAKVIIHDISRTHISYIIRDLWRYRGIILGSCTYNMKLFPPMEQLIGILENDAMKNHVLGIFGGYSWSGGGVKRLKEFAENAKWETREPVIEAKCSPSESDLEQCDRLGEEIAKAL